MQCSLTEALAEASETWKAIVAHGEQSLAEDGDVWDFGGYADGVQRTVYNDKAARLREQVENAKAALSHLKKTNRLLIGKNGDPLAPVDDEVLCAAIKAERTDYVPVPRDPSPLIEASERAKRIGETDPALQPSMKGQKAIG